MEKRNSNVYTPERVEVDRILQQLRNYQNTTGKPLTLGAIAVVMAYLKYAAQYAGYKQAVTRAQTWEVLPEAQGTGITVAEMLEDHLLKMKLPAADMVSSITAFSSTDKNNRPNGK